MQKMAKLESYGFYTCLAFCIFNVWLYPYIFNVDGMTHAANAKMIVDLLTGQCPLVQQIYELNHFLIPNWSGHLIMAALIFLGAPMLVAEKFLFSLCLILPAIGLRQLSFLKGGSFLSWLGLALAFNQLLTIAGNYNFVLGIGLCFIATAYYINQRSKPFSFVTYFVLFVLSLAIWFSHILPFLFMGTVIGVYEAILLAQNKTNRFNREFVKRLVAVSISFLPAVILTLIYAAEPFKKYHIIDFDNSRIGIPVLDILFFTDFLQINEFQVFVYFLHGYVGVFLFYHFFKKFSLRMNPLAFTFFGSAFLIWIISMPLNKSIMGGWSFTTRFHIVGWYFFIAGLSCLPWTRRQKEHLIVLIILLLTVNLAIYNVKTRQASLYASKSIAHAPPLKENSVIFTVTLNPYGDITVHYGDFGTDFATFRVPGIAASANKQCVVELNNYEAAYDYFPLHFKKDYPLNPTWALPFYLEPAGGDVVYTLKLTPFDPFMQAKMHGVELNYLLVWSSTEELRKVLPSIPWARAYYNQAIPEFDNQFDMLTRTKLKPIYQYDIRDEKWLRIYEAK